MATSVKVPAALHLAASKMGWPVMAAAMGEGAILVAASRQRNKCAVALYDDRLTLVGERVLGEGAVDAAFQVRRVVALPDGRFLLCCIWGPSWFVDRSLAATPAVVRGSPPPADGSVYAADHTNARDVFFVGGKAIVGHSSRYGDVNDYQRLCALPPSLDGTPQRWVELVGDAARANGIFVTNYYMTRGAAFAGGLVGACANQQGSGSSSHGLLWFDAQGTLAIARPDPEKRATDDKLEIVADGDHVYAASKKIIEAFDATLVPVARGVLQKHVLLAGRGGAMLWYNSRGKSFTLTAPGEVTPKTLDKLEV